jgi:hypothetical protein
MDKLRTSIQGKNRWNGLEPYIILVEQNRESDPNVSLDGAKSIVESVSKTILEDKNIKYEKSADLHKLIKKAFESLPVFSKISAEELNSSKNIIGSFENITKAIGEFRNSHGFFAHGRDIQSEKFDRYLVELVISSSELLASFLITCHSEDLKDRSRIYYEENDEFNRYIDEISEEYPVVQGIQLTPSKALFTDIEAYKEKLNDFINEKDILIKRIEDSENFVSTRSVAHDLIPFLDYLTEDELKRIVRAGIDNPQVYRILGHGYTKNLFTWVYNERKDILSQSDISGLEEAFKKKLF